jgi:16S rRNA (guanine1207-N2)-methyltransferase
MLTVKLRGREFRVFTESGVFSGARVDPGTALLIEVMDIGPGNTVLDLGCGWGAIGLAAAAMAPDGHVYLVDPNERAVALAKENAARNGLSNVTVLQGEGTEPVRSLALDVVATNPPIRAGNAAVFSMIEQARECLKPGGRFYLVARTKQGAKTIAQKVRQVFGNVTEVAKRGGYRVYMGRV